MPNEPLIRARQLLSILEHADKLPAQARQAVRGEVAPGLLAQIEASAGSDWVPFGWDVELTHAVARALGPEGTHRFFHEQQLAAWQGPLLKALVDSATALFGLDPGSWARWIPRGWNVVFRDAGRWEVERSGPGEVDLALLDPPARALDDEVWLRSLASSFSSFLAVAKAEGEFALDHVDRARGAACFRLRWHAG
jgi:hypothetical protein